LRTVPSPSASWSPGLSISGNVYDPRLLVRPSLASGVCILPFSPEFVATRTVRLHSSEQAGGFARYGLILHNCTGAPLPQQRHSRRPTVYSISQSQVAFHCFSVVSPRLAPGRPYYMWLFWHLYSPPCLVTPHLLSFHSRLLSSPHVRSWTRPKPGHGVWLVRSLVCPLFWFGPGAPTCFFASHLSHSP